MRESVAGFNPRPALPRGDAPPHLSARSSSDAFQSTPRVATGRCVLTTPSTRRPASGFNPRPALPRGDAAVCHPKQACGRLFQSTPTRCHGAMHFQDGSGYSAGGFQSTPRVATGRCGLVHDVAEGVCDCVLVTPALPRGDACCVVDDSGFEGFNPRPRCHGAMLANAAWSPTALRLFQSTPRVATGRCRSHPMIVNRENLFQSRPSVATGDAQTEPATPPTRCRSFQSTPRVATGRCLQRRRVKGSGRRR